MCECNLSQCPRPITKVKAHPHAELMMQYAQDAMETDKPWERWEYQDSQDRWVTPKSHPMWLTHLKYRRKQKTININGYEVPEPVRESGTLNNYWSVNIGHGTTSHISQWVYQLGMQVPSNLIKAGLVHTTREAAELHAKALLSFTTKG